MKHNEPTKIVFSRNGEQQSDVLGIKKQAVDYARLLSELGYDVEVFDMHQNKRLPWRYRPSVDE